MKKQVTLLIAVMLALLLSVPQLHADTITVANGNSNSYYVPLNSYANSDPYTYSSTSGAIYTIQEHIQIIYPASMLSSAGLTVGSVINSLTFYLNQAVCNVIYVEVPCPTPPEPEPNPDCIPCSDPMSANYPCQEDQDPMYPCNEIGGTTDPGIIGTCTEPYPFVSTIDFNVYIDSCSNSSFVSNVSYTWGGGFSFYNINNNNYGYGYCDVSTMSYGDGVTVTFSTPYTYTGGNILIDIEFSCPYNTCEVSWIGVDYSGASIYEEDSYYSTLQNNGTGQNFIPKTTFDYTPYVCAGPTNFNVSNITRDSVVVSWTDTVANSWKIGYSTDNNSWTYIDSITTNSYTLTGLSANTTYYLKIRANCIAPYTSDWVYAESFETLCLPTRPDSLGTVSFERSEGFVYGDGNMSNCWTIGNLESPASDWIPTILSASFYAHTGNACLCISAIFGCDGAYAVMPEMTFPNGITNYRTQFYMRKSSNTSPSTSYNDTLWVGILSDLSDFSTLQLVGYAVNSTNRYQKYSVDFANHTGGSNGYVVFLAKVDRNSTASTKRATFYVDDIVVEQLPQCVEPSDLTVSDISAFQATLSWTSDSSTSTWEVGYSTDNSTWTYIDSVNINPYTMTGLNDETTYYWRVRSHCITNDTSDWWYGNSFTTLCAPVTPESLGTISFESSDSYSSENVLSCWTVGNREFPGNSSYIPYVSSICGHNGNQCLQLSAYRKNTSSCFDSAYAVMPGMIFAHDIADYEVQFYMRNHSTSSNYNSALKVGILSNPTDFSTLQILDTAYNSTTSYQQYTVKFSNYTRDTTGYIVFLATVDRNSSSSSSYARFYVDDVIVKQQSDCFKPTDLTLDSICAHHVDLSWTAGGSETSWIVQYKPASDTVWSNVSASTNPFTLSGLASNTLYNICVQADCESLQSQCSDTISVATACDTLFITEESPFFANFDSMTNYVLPDCWSLMYGTVAVLPLMNIPEANEYMVGLKYYRNDTINEAAAIRVMYNTIPDTVGATEILHVSQNIGQTPVASEPGWYYYEAAIPTAGNIYILIDGINITIPKPHFDDIYVKKIPACGEIGSFYPSEIGRRSFTVNWTQNNLDAVIDGYQLAIDTVELNDSLLAQRTPVTVGDTVRSYTFSSLSRNTEYHVYLRPDCGSVRGTGAWSHIEMTTDTAPAIPCPQIEALFVDSITTNSVNLYWPASTADYFGNYNLYVSRTSMTDSALNLLGTYTYTGTQDSYTLNGLDEFTHYYAYLRVNCSECDVNDGSSSWITLPFRTQSACPTPDSVVIKDVDKYSFNVEWFISSGVDPSFTFGVEVRTADSTLVYSQYGLSGTTRSLAVDSLSRNTLYNVSVRTSCADSAFSYLVTDTATTLDRLPECDDYMIGNGKSISNLVNIDYGSTYSQQIYTADDLAAMGITAGNITAVKFNYANSSSTTKSQSVYIGTTSKSSFTSNTASGFVSDLTLVYGPRQSQSVTYGWNSYTFDSPFVWDGESNIVVGVLTNQPSGTSQSDSYRWNAYGTQTNDCMSICRCNSGSVIDVSSLSNTTNEGASSYSRPNIKFTICHQATPCPALKSAPTSPKRDDHSAYIAWCAGKGDFTNSYDLYFDSNPMGAVLDSAKLIIGIDSLGYYATGLTSGTKYYAYVRVNCNDGTHDDGLSGWSPVGTFLTELPCLSPLNLTTQAAFARTANLQWLDTNGASSWNIEVERHESDYYSADLKTNTLSLSDVTVSRNLLTGVDTIRYTLDSLDTVCTYSVRLQTNCTDAHNIGSSYWSEDTAKFTTLSDNVDIDTVYFEDYSMCSQYRREGDAFDLSVYNHVSLNNVPIEIVKSDTKSKVFVNGIRYTPTTLYNFNDTVPVVITVIATDTNVRKNYTLLVHHENCATPYALDTASASYRYATISWTIDEAGLQNYDYVVSSVPLDEDVLAAHTLHFSDSTASHTFDISTVFDGAYYRANYKYDDYFFLYLRHNCGDASSAWASTVFHTESRLACDSAFFNDGEELSSYIPLIYSATGPEYFLKSQFIYPSSMLTSLRGKEINKMTFFSSNDQYYCGENSFEVRVGLTTADNLDSAFLSAPSNTVATSAKFCMNDGRLEIDFYTSPFYYPLNGGNLLVQIVNNNSNVADMDGRWFEFYGTEDGDADVSRYQTTSQQATGVPGGQSASTSTAFLPKVEFGYCGEPDPCPQVKNVRTYNIQPNQVTVSWIPRAKYIENHELDTFNVIVSQTRLTSFAGLTPTVTTTSKSCTLTSLAPNTYYYVYIGTNCANGDGISGWAEKCFMTQTACCTPSYPDVLITGKHTAKAYWGTGSCSQSYNFEYILSTVRLYNSDLNNTALTDSNINNRYVILDSLASSTKYYFYVRNNCGSDGASPWNSTVFWTPDAQPAVIKLKAKDITHNSFTATWKRDDDNMASETRWLVACVEKDSTPTAWDTVDVTTYRVLSLNAETEYKFYVRPYEDSVAGPLKAISVTTLTDVGDCREFVAGDSTSTVFPYCSTWDGSYGISIYTAQELAAQGHTAGDILNVAFYQTYCPDPTDSVYYRKNATLWIGSTTKDAFVSSTDWITSGLTMLMPTKTVDFNKTGDWVNFTFDQPYTWDGTSNIAIAILINSGNGSQVSFKGGDSDRNQTIYSFSTGDSLTLTGGVPNATFPSYITPNRPDVRLCFSSDSCRPPERVVATTVTTRTAVISITQGDKETQWEYVWDYEPMTEADLTDSIPTLVTYPQFNLANLYPDNDVYVYVRSKCGTDNYTRWTQGKFHTEETCSAPIDLNVYSARDNSLTMIVNKGKNGTPLTYTYQYWISGSPDTTTIVGGDSITIDSVPAGTYSWRAKATCQTVTADGISRWTSGYDCRVCGYFVISDVHNYTQNFENVTFPSEACLFAEGTSHDPITLYSQTYTKSGLRSLHFENENSSDTSMVMLPNFMTNEDVYLSFYYREKHSSDEANFMLGNFTADGKFHCADWLDMQNKYQMERYNLSSLYPSGGNAVILYKDKGDGYIDDIRVAVQRNIVINDNLAGTDSVYSENGFNILRADLNNATDTTFTRLTTTGITDTLYTLNLRVCSVYNDYVNAVTCSNAPFIFHNKTITRPVTGWYSDTVRVQGGTDTIYNVYLQVLPSSQVVPVNESYTICSGGSYSWHGHTYTAAGNYYDTIRNSQGCDSVYHHLTLTVNQSYIYSDSMTICQGDSFSWHGRNLTVAGVYGDSLKTATGCDSVYQLTLTVNPTYLITDTQSICQGSTYNWHGMDLAAAGAYYDSLKTLLGCDSVYQLTLTVNPSYENYQRMSVCMGTPVPFRGYTFTALSYDTVVAVDPLGNHRLLIRDQIPTPHTIGIFSYTLYGDSLHLTINEKTTRGCDSITHLTVICNLRYNVAETVTAQGSQVPYSWHGQSLKKSGVYNDTLRTAAGCDSICVLNLTVIKYPAVGNIMVSGITANSFHLAWNKNQYGPETKWRVEVKDANDSTVYDKVVSNQYCDVTGLAEATTYNVTVRPRIYSTTFGNPATTTATTLDGVKAPTNVIATRTGATEITFSWANGSTTQTANYTFVVSTKKLSNPETATATHTGYTTENYAYTGTKGKNYYFYIKNVYDGRSSEWVSCTYTLVKYPAVDSLTVSDITTNSFHLAWNKNQYGSETKWRVEVKDANDSTVYDKVVSNQYCDVTGLAEATTYNVTVRPRIYSTTFGDPATTTATTLDGVKAPTNVIATRTGATEITFSWANGSTTHAANYTFLVSTKKLSNPETATATATGYTSNSYAYTGVKGKTYYFYIMNVYDGRSSEWVFCTYTLIKYPAVDSLVVSDITTNSFHLAWNKNQYGTETKWRVEVKDANDSTVYDKVVTNQYCDVTGLAEATTYNITVRPRIYSTTFGDPATTTATTLDGVKAPTNVIATRTDATEITFSWANGSTTQAANYTFVVSTKKLSNPETATATQTGYTTESYAYTGSKGKTYYFYIKNVYDGRSSEWESCTYTLVKYPAVDSLTISDVTAHTFHVEWNKNQYGTEKKWKVEVMDGSNNKVYDQVVSNQYCDVTGLSASTEYTVTVRPRIYSTTFGDPATATATTSPEQNAPTYNNDDNNGYDNDVDNDVETIAEENLSNETFTPALAYVSYDRLFVENIVAGSYVTIVDATGKTIYNAKVNDSRFEFSLYVRGIYNVVIRDEKHNQTLKVVY